MSHYAQVKNGIVQQVIVAEQDFIDTMPDSNDWIQTSYNTRGNKHTRGKPFRGNYACVGGVYDSTNDVFYDPQPYPSWVLDTKTWTWHSPIPYPMDDKIYIWDEPTLNWIELV